MEDKQGIRVECTYVAPAHKSAIFLPPAAPDQLALYVEQ